MELSLKKLNEDLKTAKLKISEYEKLLFAEKEKNKKLIFINDEYEKIFFESPNPLWLVDFSQLVAYIDELKNNGIDNFKKFLDKNPKELIKCIKLIKTKNINTAVLNIFNTNSQDYLQKNLTKIFSKNSYEIFKNVFNNIALGKNQFFAETLSKTIDGQYIYLEFAISIFAANDIYDALISIKDITARKKAELELKKLEKAVYYAPISIVITDINGNVEFVNPKVEQLTGYTKEEIIGKKPRIFKSGETDINLYKNLWNTILAGFTWQGELLNRKKNGELFWERAIISPVYCDDNKITHFVAIKEDITASKLANEQLIELTKKLKKSEKELQKETDILKELNKKLILSEKSLKEAIEIKNKFFSIIAHDIRNPLQILVSAAELSKILYQNSEFGNLEKMLDRLINTTFSLNDFIDNLLSWSRSQSGNIQFEPEEINLDELISSFKLLIEESAKKKDIDLIIKNHLNNNLVADKDLLKAIITNLLFNAIKFTPEKGKIIFEANEKEDYFEFSVSDTGVGISEENQKKLFHINSHFKTEGTNKEKGSGLGLLLVDEFVKLHGGVIDVKSIVDEGTTFTFTIPKKIKNQSSK